MSRWLSPGLLNRVYLGFEAALVVVFLTGAAISMYWLVKFSLHLISLSNPDVFKKELIHLVDLSIYTLIFLDLARTMVAAITTRRFSLEGVMEAGMLAMIREFIGLTAAEKPLAHMITVIAAFSALFIAWFMAITRARRS